MAIKIAFGHKARSGKDTCADFLLGEIVGEKVSFASTIYAIAKSAYALAGIPYEKNALLLQYLGTEWGRSIDPDIWIKCAIREIETHSQHLADDELIVVSDMRYKNEAEALKKAGFFLVRVFRPIENRGDIGRNPNHPSETDLDGYSGWNQIIDNSGTLEDLYNKVKNIYNHLISLQSNSAILL